MTDTVLQQLKRRPGVPGKLDERLTLGDVRALREAGCFIEFRPKRHEDVMYGSSDGVFLDTPMVTNWWMSFTWYATWPLNDGSVI